MREIILILKQIPKNSDAVFRDEVAVTKVNVIQVNVVTIDQSDFGPIPLVVMVKWCSHKVIYLDIFHWFTLYKQESHQIVGTGKTLHCLS